METLTIRRGGEPSVGKNLAFPLSLYEKIQEFANRKGISEADAIRLLIRVGYEAYKKEKTGESKSQPSPQPQGSLP